MSNFGGITFGTVHLRDQLRNLQEVSRNTNLQDESKSHNTEQQLGMMPKQSDLGQSSSLQSMRSNRSNVSFTTIEVHEHAMILSDGPSVSGGPAVQLDWYPQSESTMSLNEYEASKLDRPRSYPKLMIPGAFRTAILLESGYTMNEIKETASRAPSPKPNTRKTVSAKVLRMLKTSLKPSR